MSFAAPGFAVAAVLLLLLAAWRARTRVTRLEAAAAVLLLLAVARPQPPEPAALRTAPPPLVAVLDASRSMQAADPPPSRFAVACERIAERMRREPGRRIGVVAFAGAAWQAVPPTADHAAALALLAEIDPERIAVQGSEVAKALELAFDALPDGGDLLLLSDGEWDGAAPEPLRESAAKRGIRFEAAAFGSPQPVDLPPSPEAAAGAEALGQTSIAAPERMARLAAPVTPLAAAAAPERPIGLVPALIALALLALLAAHGFAGAER
ncbi:MAG: VWA domain-containing protein [Planctomycetes bacterium]|nr:VWA domain-containing protein [Planctomycetota bacterium]